MHNLDDNFRDIFWFLCGAQTPRDTETPAEDLSHDQLTLLLALESLNERITLMENRTH